MGHCWIKMSALVAMPELSPAKLPHRIVTSAKFWYATVSPVYARTPAFLRAGVFRQLEVAALISAFSRMPILQSEIASDDALSRIESQDQHALSNRYVFTEFPRFTKLPDRHTRNHCTSRVLKTGAKLPFVDYVKHAEHADQTCMKGCA